MSIWRNTPVVCPPGAGTPDTVADMIAALRYTFALPEVQSSPEQKNFISMTITVANRCAAALGHEPEYVRLDAVLASKPLLQAYLAELECTPSYTKMQLRLRDILLTYAHDLGWTCPEYDQQLALHLAWEPVRAALKDDPGGCLSIAEVAEKQLKLPSEVDPEFLSTWGAISSTRSFETVEWELGHFRSKMRQEGLESMFPLLDLRNKLRSEYAINAETHPSLIGEIEVAVRHKTDKKVEGRPGKERVKPTGGQNIRTALKEYVGINITLGLPIETVSDAFREDNWRRSIRHMREDRGLPADGIRSRLGCLTFLPKTGLLPKGDYSWMQRELRKLRREPRWRLDERQRARCIAREELLKVPQGIRVLRLESSVISPKQHAKLLHDELLTSWGLYLPWRFCSIADCGLYPPAQINIIHAELTPAMRLDPDLPAWVKKAIKTNKHARFLQLNFGSGQTKNGAPVRELMPLELVGIYSQYLKFRKFLVDEDDDDGTLFVNSRGRRLSRQACRDLYQKLVRKWLGLHARPHLNRDSYCEHALSHGGTRRQIGKKLWQKTAVSTERYCRRYDASYGAVALEQKLNQASKRRAA